MFYKVIQGGLGMLVDDNIVLKYLSGENVDMISKHWVFRNIEKDKYLFEVPDAAKKDEVNKILISIKKILLEFTPLNEEIYSTLYPQWQLIIKDMNVLLLVGCPKPYDAMVIENGGKEYVIFDLIRFCDYSLQGYDIEMLIRQLITHETAHLCLHRKYPVPISDNFLEQLKYTTFDEGFAHLLAFKDNIRQFDFSTIIKEHYNQAIIKLHEAMKEDDCEKQKVLLEQSNSGPYWDKFAAISGKLFLASHLEDIQKIYNDGIDNFISCLENK